MLESLSFEMAPLFVGYGTAITPKKSDDLNALEVDRIIACLKSSGLVLLRGFGASIEDFTRFSDSFKLQDCPHVFPAAMRPEFREQRRFFDVFWGQDRVELHSELAFLPRPPDILWFYCMQASERGGETTFSDGIDLLDRLSAPTRELFSSTGLSYSFVLEAESWQRLTAQDDLSRAQATIAALPGIRAAELGDNRSLKIVFETSAIKPSRFQNRLAFVNSIPVATQAEYLHLKLLRVMLADGRELPNAVIEEIHGLGQTATDALVWKPGDVAILDNSRLMHGRNAFSGERKMATRHSFLR